MYNKSRMTIFKLLLLESTSKINALAVAGVRLEAKRCRVVRHPELEWHVYEAVGLRTRLTSKAEIWNNAQDIARDLNISDFEGNSNWVLQFIQQHNLVVSLLKPDTLSLFLTRKVIPKSCQRQGLRVQRVKQSETRAP